MTRRSMVFNVSGHRARRNLSWWKRVNSPRRTTVEASQRIHSFDRYWDRNPSIVILAKVNVRAKRCINADHVSFADIHPDHPSKSRLNTNLMLNGSISSHRTGSATSTSPVSKSHHSNRNSLRRLFSKSKTWSTPRSLLGLSCIVFIRFSLLLLF